ncbi:MAG TPA: RNA methyltransferase [Polyangiaceae bacterium]|nr:RNA methyltransferase [Polyangiaceae bacterium]
MRRKSRNVTHEFETADPWSPEWTPAGVIEALSSLATDARRERLRTVIDARLTSVTVLMDAPHDPHNGGAVLRSCDAFGVQRLCVVPRTEAFAISTTVTRGSEKWVDVELHRTPSEAVRVLTGEGFVLVATHPAGTLVPENLATIPKLALVLGNERDGIREELESAATHTVRVPMRGFVESLNMSVSAAILLAGATRNRPGDLTEEHRARLYARGLYRSLLHAGDALAAQRPR